MKNQILAILTITAVCLLALLGCASSDPEDDLISNNSGEPTIMEGIWISNCRAESLGGYIRFTNTFAGNTYKLEQLTYSDNQCTQISSGNDYRAEGTFTLADGGTLEGKQLTKITATITVQFSERFAAVFTPIGSTQTIVAKQYLDGGTSYETDDFYDFFNGQYSEPTKIVYEEYLVKQ